MAKKRVSDWVVFDLMSNNLIVWVEAVFVPELGAIGSPHLSSRSLQ
jgi:hypothetical protein